jgi:peptide/nickel transport system substrate-binding protein
VGYTPDVPFYEYNPEKAKQLLAEAGYPHGFEFTFHTVTDMPPAYQTICQYFRDVGLKVNIKVTTTPVVMNAIIRKKLYGMVSWSAGRGRETAKQFFDSTMRYNGIWAMHAKDERVEALVEKQGKDFDQERRAKTIQEVVKILWEDAWFVPLWEPVVIKAIRNEWEYEDWPAALSIYLTNLSRKTSSP